MTFAKQIIDKTADQTNAAVAADLDGDVDNGFVTANQDSNTIPSPLPNRLTLKKQKSGNKGRIRAVRSIQILY